MRYDKFIEDARKYRITFEYFFNIKSANDYLNKWIIITILFVSLGLTIYISSIDNKNLANSNFPALLTGIAIIFIGGYFRSKFDREKLISRLIKENIISHRQTKLKKWELKRIYLEKTLAPRPLDLLRIISSADEIEIAIHKHQNILDKVIGFSIIENLFSIKFPGNTTIFTLGIGALGAVGGMYLTQLKEQLSGFYNTPLEFLAICSIIFIFAVAIIFVASMVLGITGLFTIRYLDLYGQHLSKYARSSYKLDLLMLSNIDAEFKPKKNESLRPSRRYKTKSQ